MPESHLHISFQCKLAKFILEEINDKKVLIITHSPGIIDDYKEFAYELQSKRFRDTKYF